MDERRQAQVQKSFFLPHTCSSPPYILELRRGFAGFLELLYCFSSFCIFSCHIRDVPQWPVTDVIIQVRDRAQNFFLLIFTFSLCMRIYDDI